MYTWATLKRTVREFQDDNLTDWAAALTYYAVLSIFPALIALVAILGLVGQHPETTNALLEIVDDVGPGVGASTRSGPDRERRRQSSGGAGAAARCRRSLGAIWAASGYIGAFIRASNAIYEVEEGRPFWKLRPLQVAITVGDGAAARAVRDRAGGHGAAGASGRRRDRRRRHGRDGLGHRQVAGDVVVVMAMFAVLYYAAPNVRQPRFG